MHSIKEAIKDSQLEYISFNDTNAVNLGLESEDELKNFTE